MDSEEFLLKRKTSKNKTKETIAYKNIIFDYVNVQLFLSFSV